MRSRLRVREDVERVRLDLFADEVSGKSPSSPSPIKLIGTMISFPWRLLPRGATGSSCGTVLMILPFSVKDEFSNVMGLTGTLSRG